MYVPPQFEESDLAALHRAIAETGLATLVSLGGAGLIASHVPLILIPEEGPNGTLYGHFSKANPHGRESPAIETLAMFLGPDFYVTPSWYESKKEHGKVVPTWNYVAIHAYGTLELFDDKERLLDLVTKLTERHEAGRAAPWAVSDAPADFVQAQLKGIIGFRLPIARLQGKWKMSQNRTQPDRVGVAAGLRTEGKEALAGLVKED